MLLIGARGVNVPKVPDPEVRSLLRMSLEPELLAPNFKAKMKVSDVIKV